MDKTWEYSKSAIIAWYENGHGLLLGAQSINTESFFNLIYNLAIPLWPVIYWRGKLVKHTCSVKGTQPGWDSHLPINSQQDKALVTSGYESI